MNNSSVSLEKIELRNFKNVRHGVLSLGGKKAEGGANVLGLYGQNGSGKTSVIEALSILREVLAGRSLLPAFADFVNVASDHAELSFRLLITDRESNAEYRVSYALDLKREEVVGKSESDPNSDVVSYAVRVSRERLSYSGVKNGRSISSRVIADTAGDEAVFTPISKYRLLTGGGRKTNGALMANKHLARLMSRSFLFSPEFLKSLDDHREDLEKKGAELSEEYLTYLFIFKNLSKYGNWELFTISTANSGLITLNALPLSFRYTEGNVFSSGSVMLSLHGATLIPNSALSLVKKLISSMNIVLKQLVPGLTLDIVTLREEIRDNGEKATSVQLVSQRGGQELPFRLESEGIKKIVSILQLLIVVYNSDSFTVAIDELDSGVFEYLLGELLKIISDHGRGQLIFTSHNLRPLETIDKNSVAFTTTDPDNRYVRPVNLKPNNNLRDWYYRDIQLSVSETPLYDSTNNSEIAFALREAGELSRG